MRGLYLLVAGRGTSLVAVHGLPVAVPSRLYHIFFIHSSADEHVSCFCDLVAVNSAAANSVVHITPLLLFISETTETRGIPSGIIKVGNTQQGKKTWGEVGSKLWSYFFCWKETICISGRQKSIS